MKPKTYLSTMFVLTLAGVLFSGYLGVQKLFTGVCAFNESCPYFWGYPACWYGFGLFLLMFVMVIIAQRKISNIKKYRLALRIVSFLGILFAGQFVIGEVSMWLGGISTDYTLVLPTCVYGLIFYIAIFIISFVGLRDTTE